MMFALLAAINRLPQISIWVSSALVQGPMAFTGRSMIVLMGTAEQLGRRLRRTAACFRLERLRSMTWARRGALLGTIVVAAVTFAPLLLLAWAKVSGPWVWPHYEYKLERFGGTTIFDSKGRFLGLLPGPMDAIGDFFPPDHKSVHVLEVPGGWLRCLAYLEDRHRTNPWRSAVGVDAPGFIRAASTTWRHGSLQGASTLPMQLVRSLHHDAAEPNDPIGRKAARKITELLHAPVLADRLRGDALDRALAMHLPLAIGAPRSGLGGTLYGLGTTSWTVFGVPPSSLSSAQQAVLAAAVHRPIVLAPSNDATAMDLARRRWSALQRRAERCVSVLAADEVAASAGSRPLSAATDALRGEIAALPLPVPPIDSALESFLPVEPKARLAILAHPFRRALFFLSAGELTETMAELQEHFGRRWRASVTAVHLTADARDVVSIKGAVERQLLGMQRALVIEDNAQILLGVADESGRILALYSNNQESAYSGSRHLRAVDGRYQPDRETRQVGSLGKIVIAVYLGMVDHPAQPYCNQARAGVRNADRGTGVARCSQPGAWYTAEQVFARSLNLPLLSRLRASDDAALAKLAESVGLVLPQGVPPRSALTLGLAAASPQRLHRLMALVMRGVVHEPLQAALPWIVDRVEVFEAEGLRAEAILHPAYRSDTLATYFPGSRGYVERVLSAPLDPGGTLQRLGHWRAGVRPGVLHHLGKTGTTVTSSRMNTRDAYALGGLVFEGRTYTYVALITGADRRIGGGRPSGGDTAPLVAAALDVLLSTHAP